MRPAVKIIFAVGILLGVPGVAYSQGNATYFDTSIFRNKETYRTILGFDLRNDDNPRTGLWLKPGTIQQSTGNAETRFLPLGIPMSGPVISQDLIVLSGKVSGCCSLVAYLRTGSTSSEYGFAFPVEFSQPPPNLSSLETLGGRVYLLKLGPAQRLFLYRYGGKDFDEAFADIKNLSTTDKLDAIAIALPPGAVGSGIEGNRTSVPDPLAKNDIASFFPGEAPSPEVRTLQVSYTLPPTANQQLWINSILQLIGVVAVPLIALVFWDKASRKTLMFKIMLGSAAILEFGAIGTIIWLGIRARNTDTIQAFISVIVAVIGMTFSAYLATIKRRDKVEETNG